MLNDSSFFFALILLFGAVFTTRIAGVFLMQWITVTPRIERFLEGLAVSVIAALVASILVSANAQTIASTAIALAFMALLKNVVWAMLSGMIAASLLSYFW